MTAPSAMQPLRCATLCALLLVCCACGPLFGGRSTLRAEPLRPLPPAYGPAEPIVCPVGWTRVRNSCVQDPLDAQAVWFGAVRPN